MANLITQKVQPSSPLIFKLTFEFNNSGKIHQWSNGSSCASTENRVACIYRKVKELTESLAKTANQTVFFSKLEFECEEQESTLKEDGPCCTLTNMHFGIESSQKESDASVKVLAKKLSELTVAVFENPLEEGDIATAIIKVLPASLREYESKHQQAEKKAG